MIGSERSMACSGLSKRAESTISAKRTSGSRLGSEKPKCFLAVSAISFRAGRVGGIEEVVRVVRGFEGLTLGFGRKSGAMVIEIPGELGRTLEAIIEDRVLVADQQLLVVALLVHAVAARPVFELGLREPAFVHQTREEHGARQAVETMAMARHHEKHYGVLPRARRAAARFPNALPKRSNRRWPASE